MATRSKFNREKFAAEFEAEVKRRKDTRQASGDAALKAIREKNWPQWLKRLAGSGMWFLLERHKARHAPFDAAGAAWRANRKARDS